MIVVIIVISVAAIVSLAKTIFFSGSSTTQTTQQKTADTNALLSTAADRGVRMTVRGSITGDEKFRSYQIVVKPGSRSMTTYNGYLDAQRDTVTLENNAKAYEEFVYALNRAGMMDGEPLKDKDDDVRGLCATGKILTFETIQNDASTKRLWTTTCSNAKGSLKANATALGDMFLQQVPQSKTLLESINK